MKKIFITLILLLVSSCGEYVEDKIDLTQPQIDAITLHLSQECITNNETLFNQLATNTVDFTNSEINEKFIYEFQTTNKETKKFVILKRTADLMYIYVESTDPELKSRVYKYTTTDNANHIANIKSSACLATNTFSGDANSFNYIPVSYVPDTTDPDRISYSSSYTVQGDRPVFFSLFNRKFTKRTYVEDALKTTDTVEVSYNITTADFDDTVKATYETPFGLADHCTFNTPAVWLDANFPDSFASSMTCAPNIFSWADVN